jgi:hypothetical protein
MRVLLVLAGTVALGFALFWGLSVRGPDALPKQPVPSELMDSVADQPQLVRVVAPLRSPGVVDPMTETAEADVVIPPVPHEPPSWLDAARFEKLGLTRQQASDLAAGLQQTYYGCHLQTYAEPKPQDVISTSERVLCGLGEHLLALLDDDLVLFTWRPRDKPWPHVAGTGWSWNEIDDGRPRLTYTVIGRFGFATLRIPESICDPVLWRELVASQDAARR